MITAKKAKQISDSDDGIKEELKGIQEWILRASYLNKYQIEFPTRHGEEKRLIDILTSIGYKVNHEIWNEEKCKEKGFDIMGSHVDMLIINWSENAQKET